MIYNVKVQTQLIHVPYRLTFRQANNCQLGIYLLENIHIDVSQYIDGLLVTIRLSKCRTLSLYSDYGFSLRLCIRLQISHRNNVNWHIETKSQSFRTYRRPHYYIAFNFILMRNLVSRASSDLQIFQLYTHFGYQIRWPKNKIHREFDGSWCFRNTGSGSECYFRVISSYRLWTTPVFKPILM